MNPRMYLGLSCSQHDPAIALVDGDGCVVFAESTERHLQDKRAWHTPPLRLNRAATLLNQWITKPNTTIVAASSWSARRFAATTRNTSITIDNYPTTLDLERASPATIFRMMQSISPTWLLPAAPVMASLARHPWFVPAAPVMASLAQHRALDRNVDSIFHSRSYDHHTCHAWYAYLTSSFDDATCVVADGMGEGGAFSVFEARDGTLECRLDSTSAATFSLGAFYTRICWMCGFDPNKGEEWKVMGLAPYGEADRDVVARIIRCIDIKAGTISGHLYTAMKPLTHLKRDALAATGQRAFEEILFSYLRSVAEFTDSENLVLSGGCALNSAANGKIVQNTPFKALHVPSAPADDGNAVGAALLAFRQDHPGQAIQRCTSPYLGSTLDSAALQRAIALGGLRPVDLGRNTISSFVAEQIAAGKIVGWAVGRAEFGPRALGNRSILADPRDASMKDRINARVKFREGFRPFAPSILHAHGERFFEDYQDTPYMERALRFREEVQHLVPAVVHVDGTGRLQSVHRALNPAYSDLIEEFYRITNVPILLNTSFNIMGKPIVHSVEDVIAVFFTSGLDVVVIDDRIFVKEHRPDRRSTDR